MEEIPPNPPSTAQISAEDPQMVEVNLYWTIPVEFNIEDHPLPTLKAHHYWKSQITCFPNSLIALKFRLDDYEKRSRSGQGNTPFYSTVTCTLYVNNVSKTRKGQKMWTRYGSNDSEDYDTYFQWLSDQVLNPEAPGTPQNLKIHFKVTYPKSNDWPEPQEKAVEVVPLAKPKFTFEEFLFSPEMSDLDILTDTGEVIKAHKIILAGKSPAFARMFLGPFVKSKDSHVIIEDFKGEIVKLMLRFLYTGEIGSKKLEDVLQLLEIADKFGILELKDQCEAEIKNQLKMDNLMEVLGMVFKGKLQNAKGILAEFIVKNLEECKKIEDFKEFSKNGDLDFAGEFFLAELDLEMTRKPTPRKKARKKDN